MMSGIRLIAIRVGLAALTLVALWGVWRFTAERWSLLVDRVYTARMQVIRSTPFGWNGTYLQFEDAIPGLVGLKGFNPGERLVGAHLLELSGPGPEYKQAPPSRSTPAVSWSFSPAVGVSSSVRAPAQYRVTTDRFRRSRPSPATRPRSSSKPVYSVGRRHSPWREPI
jgi:hypothetical protein